MALPTWLTMSVLGCSLVACGGSSNNGGGDDGSGGGSGSGTPDAPAGFTGTTVPLVSFDELLYTAPLTIGTQTFQTQIDTGSTITAVADASCTSCTTVGITPTYAPGSTAHDTGKTDDTEYEDNSGWSGEVYTDTAGVAPALMTTLGFVSITDNMNDFFGDNSYQGILGLGPAGLLTQGTGETAYPDAAAAATGTGEVFGFHLCPDAGKMYWGDGGFDPAAVTAAPVTTPIDGSYGFYDVHMSSLSLGDTMLGSDADIGPMTVDTGTSVSLVPTPVANALTTALNGSSGFQALFPGKSLSNNTEDFSCVDAGTVTADQVDAMLPPLVVSFPSASGAPQQMSLAATRSYIWVDTDDHAYCLSLVDGGQIQDDYAGLIGDTMMQSFVVVFDIEHTTMGFAPQGDCAEAPVPPRLEGPLPDLEPGRWWLRDPRVHLPPRVRARMTR